MAVVPRTSNNCPTGPSVTPVTAVSGVARPVPPFPTVRTRSTMADTVLPRVATPPRPASRPARSPAAAACCAWPAPSRAPLLLAALVTAGSPGWGLYTIKHGDTLSDIAANYDTTVAKLVEVNRLPGNGNLIIAGNTLKVPGAGSASASGEANPPGRLAATPCRASRQLRRVPGRHRHARTACRARTSCAWAPRCASPAAAAEAAAQQQRRSTSSAATPSPAAPTRARWSNAAARNRAALARRTCPRERHAGHHRRARPAPTASTRPSRWP